MYLGDSRPEILKSKRLQIQYFVVIGLFIAGVIFVVSREKWLIKSLPVLIKAAITERDVNYKRQGTLYIDYKVEGKGVFRAVASVSFSEEGVNRYYLVGDSVYVAYYEKDPSKNEVFLNNRKLIKFIEENKTKLSKSTHGFKFPRSPR